MLHPANAETVNYIIARTDVQSTLFVLLGLVMYAFSPFCRKTYLYLIAVGIGALCKPTAVMFAPILFFYILFFEEKIGLNEVFKKALQRHLGRIPKNPPCYYFLLSVVCADGQDDTQNLGARRRVGCAVSYYTALCYSSLFRRVFPADKPQRGYRLEITALRMGYPFHCGLCVYSGDAGHRHLYIQKNAAAAHQLWHNLVLFSADPNLKYHSAWRGIK